ncbi:MAG: LysR family transcriptional regulator [Bdellovibrionales bacterium]|jgi:DNA-binding transcriptional LysR family regulator|nr:LysR family transcriptional regulator [Bdellovibrionales bacterium]
MKTTDINAAHVFVRVVQAGSFSGAAKNLDMPISTVSAKVKTLEKQLGVSLLQRSTRKLNLTEMGAVYYQHAARAILDLEQAEALTQEAQAAIQGRVRMTAPVEIGTSTLTDVIATFLSKYPKVHVELILTDRVVDIIGERIDIALRMGDLKDSSLVSKRIGHTATNLYASPAYLKKNPAIKRPQDLEKHACLLFTNLKENEWLLERGNQRVRVRVQGPFSANNLVSLHRATLEGQGLALLPHFLCQEDIEKKRLIPILEDWATKRHPVHLVYPAQSFLPKTTRSLIDYISENLHHLF